ncbi:MAG TPA: hypothetical protein VIW67_12515 [Terriglobales bacterium]|jgi:hypothetical protein
MKRLAAALTIVTSIIMMPRADSIAWNIPGHMLSGAIAYQILQRESPTTIPSVRSALEKNLWYETRWKSQLEKLPQAERDEMLFMLAARWADDIRTRDKAESHPPWHYSTWLDTDSPIC